jgi:DNA-binding PadR family transcriptional regulator
VELLEKQVYRRVFYSVIALRQEGIDGTAYAIRKFLDRERKMNVKKPTFTYGYINRICRELLAAGALSVAHPNDSNPRKKVPYEPTEEGLRVYEEVLNERRLELENMLKHSLREEEMGYPGLGAPNILNHVLEGIRADEKHAREKDPSIK